MIWNVSNTGLDYYSFARPYSCNEVYVYNVNDKQYRYSDGSDHDVSPESGVLVGLITVG